MSENRVACKRKVLAAVITFLCFLLFGGVCFAAGSLIWQQGREVDVSVDTSGESFTESVTFTVSNILGMDILIDERENSCAMLQCDMGGEWTDVCEIRFAGKDSAALSVKYGGMYAHLAPGMELQYRLDEELLETLPSGEYRIAIPYISEDAYLKYLQDRAEDIDESLENALEESVQANAALSDAELSGERSDQGSAGVSADESEEAVSQEQSEEVSGDLSEESIRDETPEIQILYKEFRFVSRADSSADESAEETVSGGLDVSIAVE